MSYKQQLSLLQKQSLVLLLADNFADWAANSPC